MVEQLMKTSNLTNYVYADCRSITGQIYTDKYAPIFILSAIGIKYLMVRYYFDRNLIWSTTIPYKTKLQLITAYKFLCLFIQWQGIHPQLQHLYNEFSNFFKQLINSNNVEYQLTPKVKHSFNSSKKAIQTWKDHFLSGMASYNPDFPL